MPIIKAITFDLWDTVFINDSDEPKRKDAGELPKPQERRRLVHEVIHGDDFIQRDLVNTVYDAVDEAFKRVWYELNCTWTVRERLSIVLKGLGTNIPEDSMNELVRLHEEMELEFRPDFVPGVHEALDLLHNQYKLGVISDTIFSPGRTLRTLLADEGLLDYFDILIFSDEVGRSKPAPDVFLSACDALNIQPEELVHVGDRELKDIEGPHLVGARGVLCTAVIDRGSSNTKADAVFDSYKSLQKIIEKLND